MPKIPEETNGPGMDKADVALVHLQKMGGLLDMLIADTDDQEKKLVVLAGMVKAMRKTLEVKNEK